MQINLTKIKSYQKGDVVDVDLGLPPVSIKGHEQAKERPCIVVKPFNSLDLSVILPITSSQPPKHLYTFVYLPKGVGGLSKDSYVLCHQIRTVSTDRITRRRGTLDTKDLLKIQSVLVDTLEL